MIVISSDENDKSTDQVIDWLHHYKKEFIRINPSSKIKILNVTAHDFEINIEDEFKNVKINLKNVTSYWYRRGYFNVVNGEKIKTESKIIENEINEFLYYEATSLEHFLIRYTKLFNKTIGHISFNYTNKIENLNIAKKCGLPVPVYLITNNKKSLKEWWKKLPKKEIIWKPINRAINFLYDKKYARSYTSVVTEEHLENIPEEFFPSQFQEKLEKEFEIRTFFLNDKSYSMAIFSQNDDQTKIDFRKYNESLPNRCTIFSLPVKIENKIKLFMKEINLNCGSLDIVYTKDKEYVFLEVNPVGQFGMVSGPTNTYLEKIVALAL